MNGRPILIFWFGLGVLIQAILLIQSDLKWGKLAGCVGLGLCGMLPGKHEYNYELLPHIFICFCLFAVSFAMFFKEDILPVISEKVLLSYSLIFWFSFFSYFYKDAFIHKFLFFLFLIPSLATVFIAFIKLKLNFWGKLFFYSWFLIIVVALGLFRFSFSHFSLFFDEQHVPWFGPIDCALTGMAFLYIIVNATYIWELIPLRGKNQSWKNRMKEWHELTSLMTQRCDGQQPTHLQTILILVLQGGGLFINYLYHLIPADLVVNVLILLPAVLLMGNSTTKIALQGSMEAMSKEI
ncbi:MAG: hypothetical protein HQL12_05485 [Candidatus Omnitrophica bacterium]|nr:hypothetical protein [Candidatus Omnitrophota bacterium]